jgi:hypothetical protein
MPKVSIRPGMPEDLVAVQAANLAAFRPIDESFAEILGPEIYPLVYPDWQTSQQRDVEQLVANRTPGWLSRSWTHGSWGLSRSTAIAGSVNFALLPGVVTQTLADRVGRTIAHKEN